MEEALVLSASIFAMCVWVQMSPLGKDTGDIG